MTDAVARYKRARGYDVFFCTGTDEHGQKIENLANEAGITPKEYVDKVAAEIKTVWDKMNTSYDYFIRTTDDYHEKTVQKIFKKFYDKGDIYKGFYEGWYCTPCESFFTDTQVVAFEPVYREYRKALGRVSDKSARIKKDELTNENALKVMAVRLSNTINTTSVKQKYLFIFAEVIEPLQIEKLYRIDDRISKEARKIVQYKK